MNMKFPLLGIRVARYIVKGDVQAARLEYLLNNRKSWSVPEARAIIGACKFAQKKLNACVYFEEFIK